MEARMEERLTVNVEIAADTRECLVPQLLLQPLVENAIRYGADPRSFQVDIRASAIRENGECANLRARSRTGPAGDAGEDWNWLA